MGKSLGAQVFTSFPGLEAIERTARKRAITMKAVKAGAKLVQQAAKAAAPKRSGLLKRALGVKSQKGSRGKTLAFAVVGARRKVEAQFKGRKTVPAYYAHLVEKGTKPHSLLKRAKSKGGKAVRLVRIAAGAGPRHPGARPHPFLKPALDSQKVQVSRAMLDALAAEIARVLARIPKAKAKGNP